jgi:hypothetical protein
MLYPLLLLALTLPDKTTNDCYLILLDMPELFCFSLPQYKQNG